MGVAFPLSHVAAAPAVVWVVVLLQELMWRGTDPLVVLRLLVLLSFTGNGLPKKHAGENVFTNWAHASLSYLCTQHDTPAWRLVGVRWVV